MSAVFPTILPALLNPSSGFLNASEFLMFTDNGSSFFGESYTGRSGKMSEMRLLISLSD